MCAKVKNLANVSSKLSILELNLISAIHDVSIVNRMIHRRLYTRGLLADDLTPDTIIDIPNTIGRPIYNVQIELDSATNEINSIIDELKTLVLTKYNQPSNED